MRPDLLRRERSDQKDAPAEVFADRDGALVFERMIWRSGVLGFQYLVW